MSEKPEYCHACELALKDGIMLSASNHTCIKTAPPQPSASAEPSVVTFNESSPGVTRPEYTVVSIPAGQEREEAEPGQRVLFENWARWSGLAFSLAWDHGRGGYIDPDTWKAFKAWLAGRAALRAEGKEKHNV